MAAATLLRPNDLTGERGLLAAVIAQAVKDLKSCDEDARCDAQRYLTSDVYRHHLELLGLQPDLLPAGVEGELQKMKQPKKKNAAFLLNSIVRHRAEEQGITYHEAFAQLQREKPRLFAAYQASDKRPAAGSLRGELEEVQRRGRIIEVVNEVKEARELGSWYEAVAYVLANPGSVELDPADMAYLRQGVNEAEAKRVEELERLIRGSLALAKD